MAVVCFVGVDVLHQADFGLECGLREIEGIAREPLAPPATGSPGTRFISDPHEDRDWVGRR